MLYVILQGKLESEEEREDDDDHDDTPHKDSSAGQKDVVKQVSRHASFVFLSVDVQVPHRNFRISMGIRSLCFQQYAYVSFDLFEGSTTLIWLLPCQNGWLVHT